MPCSNPASRLPHDSLKHHFLDKCLTTTVCRLHLPVTSPATLAFPRKGSGSAYREYPLKRLLSGANFRGCSHVVMFRPLRLLATLVALHLHCFQQGSLWRLTPSRTCVVTFACIGDTSRPNQAIDGARTFTSLDSQPCRLLPLALRYDFTSIRLSKGLSPSSCRTCPIRAWRPAKTYENHSESGHNTRSLERRG